MPSETDAAAVLIFERGNDVSVLASVSEAAGRLEAVDVVAGEYVAAFTHTGVALRLGTADGRVTLAFTSGRDEERLRQLLASARRDLAFNSQDDVRAYVNDELAFNWRRAFPMWPAWLHERIHGAEPPKV